MNDQHPQQISNSVYECSSPQQLQSQDCVGFTAILEVTKKKNGFAAVDVEMAGIKCFEHSTNQKCSALKAPALKVLVLLESNTPRAGTYWGG